MGLTREDRPLTGKMDHFAMRVGLLMEGLSDAYRNAYNADGMKASSIYAESSKLSRDPRVAQRIREYRKDVVDKHAISTTSDRERSIEILRKAAKGENVTPVQLKAAQLLGETCGLFDQNDDSPVVPRSSEAVLQDLLDRIQDVGDRGPAVIDHGPCDDRERISHTGDTGAVTLLLEHAQATDRDPSNAEPPPWE